MVYLMILVWLLNLQEDSYVQTDAQVQAADK